MRMVRRGFKPAASMMRTASMKAAAPTPLSVAPVPDRRIIHVPAQHDQFILQIRSRNFGDGIVSHGIS